MGSWRKSALWGVFVLLGLLALTACAAAHPAAAAPSSTTQKKLELIEFYSPMWTSCRLVHPIVNGLKKEYGERVTFVQVNILDADSQPLMKQYGFSATPELYLVDGRGKVIHFWDGVDSAQDLKPVIDQALKQAGGWF